MVIALPICILQTELFDLTINPDVEIFGFALSCQISWIKMRDWVKWDSNVMISETLSNSVKLVAFAFSSKNTFKILKSSL